MLTGWPAILRRWSARRVAEVRPVVGGRSAGDVAEIEAGRASTARH